MLKKHKKIPRSFYDRPTLEVARDVLGKELVFHSKARKLSAKIVEVEAYIGERDPACHAHRGKTKRNAPLFGKPGFSYVYLIYGMYFCFNLVTEEEGSPAALLIRAGHPGQGIETMHGNSPNKKASQLLNGPGKFCRSFGIDMKQNCLDLTSDTIYLEDRFVEVEEIVASTRIGIREGRDLRWRFFDRNSDSVSQK